MTTLNKALWVTLGIACGFAGIAVLTGGFYLGIVSCLIGGIVDIINAIKAEGPVQAITVAVAIVKIVFFEVPIVVGFFAMLALWAATLFIFGEKVT